MAVNTAQLQSLTHSQQTLALLQSRFGTMQLTSLQTIRRRFYSYIPYPAAGAATLQFFGNAIGSGGVNQQFTNMPVSASFGTSHFLIKACYCTYFIPINAIGSYVGTDSSTLYSEIVDGLFTAGELELVINAKSQLQVPKPWFYMPPGDGRPVLSTAGQTLASFFDTIPYADLQGRLDNKFLVDPELFIAAQQNFTCQINFPSGQLVPIISTLLDVSGYSLNVGVVLDGIELRPTT